jgi:hypothetical protein
LDILVASEDSTHAGHEQLRNHSRELNSKMLKKKKRRVIDQASQILVGEGKGKF